MTCSCDENDHTFENGKFLQRKFLQSIAYSITFSTMVVIKKTSKKYFGGYSLEIVKPSKEKNMTS